MDSKEKTNQTQSHIPPLSIEDALEMKEEMLLREKREDKDLSVLLKQLESGSKQAYLEQLSGVKRIYAEIKEFIGYGIEHDYKALQNKLGKTSEQLSTATESTGKLIGEYKQRERDTREAYSRAKKMLILNYAIVSEKEKQKAEKQAQLETLESPSVLGHLNTAEALNLEDEIAELDEDLWQLDMESDEAAVKFKIAEGTQGTIRSLRQDLQSVYRDLQKQRTMFDAHVEIDRVQDRIVGKLKGVESVKVLYARAGELISQLEGMQSNLQRGLTPMPRDFQIASPATAYREKQDGRSYWRSVVQEIQLKR